MTTYRRSLLYAVAGLMAASAAFAFDEPPLKLIPQPRELHRTSNRMDVRARTSILLASSSSSNGEASAADLLQEELRERGHAPLEIAALGTSTAPSAIMLGLITEPAIRREVAEHHWNDTGLGPEGYLLAADSERVVIAGVDPAGLLYGVQTLRQLLSGVGEHLSVPGVLIRDWPALRYRGTQVDLSRGPVPNLNYLENIVRTIAEYKMNQLNLYMEDAFPLTHHPLIGALDDTLSQNDFRTLVAFASHYFVDIVPSTEGCGHLHKVFRFEQYSGMAERPHGHVFAAGDNAAAAYLQDFYGELSAVFPSQFDNVGCDETVELGKGRSAQAVKTDGYGAVYAAGVQRAAAAVRRYGKQPVFWGDMVVDHPDATRSLPRDLIAATWEYFPHPAYEKWLKPFTAAGMKFIVCPWTATTGLIVPDYDEAALNIAGFLSDGKRNGAIGANITVWNDSGETLYAPNWWAIVFGAANAWEQRAVPVSEFDRNYDWAFYRASGSGITQAMKDLGHLNEKFREHHVGTIWSPDYGGTDDHLFWRSPFAPDGRKEAEHALPIAAEVRLTAERAYSVFTEQRPEIRHHADSIDALRFAALKLDALGMRYQYLREMRGRYQHAILDQSAPHSSTADDLFEIVGPNGRLADLRDYTTRLRELYQQLWLQENLPHWLPNVLQLYDRNSQLWQQSIQQFDTILVRQHDGTPLPGEESVGLAR